MDDYVSLAAAEARTGSSPFNQKLLAKHLRAQLGLKFGRETRDFADVHPQERRKNVRDFNTYEEGAEAFVSQITVLQNLMNTVQPCKKARVEVCARCARTYQIAIW